MTNTIGKPASDPNKLLKLIKDGDAELLLAEGNLGRGFNELLNLDLISIEEGKVSITQLGEEALKTGIKANISHQKKNPDVQPVITNLPVMKYGLGRKKWLLALLLFLFILVLLASQIIS